MHKDFMREMRESSGIRTILKENISNILFVEKSRWIFSLFLTILIQILFNHYNVFLYPEKIQELTGIFLGGFIGMTALGSATISIVLSTMDEDFFNLIIDQTENIEEKDCVSETKKKVMKAIRGLYFPFYFLALLDLISIILLFLSWVLLNIPEVFWVKFLFEFFTIYFCIYTFLYNIEILAHLLKIRFITLHK